MNEDSSDNSLSCTSFVQTCENGYVSDITAVETGFSCYNNTIIESNACPVNTCDWNGMHCVDENGKWYKNDCTSYSITCDNGILLPITHTPSGYRCYAGTYIKQEECACEPVTYECTWSGLRCTDWLGTAVMQGCSDYYEICMNHHLSSPIKAPAGYACYNNELVKDTSCKIYPDNQCSFCLLHFRFVVECAAIE